MYLLYAPEQKFGKLKSNTPILCDEVKFTFNVAYCAKFFWQKYHIIQGCRDITPRWMIRMRRRRTLSNILIVGRGGLGDTMWLMPFAKALRQKFPRAAILIACSERVMPLWHGVPYANICVKSDFWNLQNIIRGADEVFDFGGVATYMEKERRLAPVEAIFKLGDLPLPKDKKDCRPMLVIEIGEGKKAEGVLKTHDIDPKTDKIICIGLESSTPNRDWPFEYNKELSRMLIADGFKVIWLGESMRYESELVGDETNSIGVVNLVRRTKLREVMAIIALSDVFVGPISGLLHIAAALEVPSVGLFGAYNPKIRDKFWIKNVNLWHKLNCAPCSEHWTECPKGHPAPCMKILQPDEVHETIIQLYKKYPRQNMEKLPIE